MIRIEATLSRNLEQLAKKHADELEPVVLAGLGRLRVRQRQFIQAHIRELLTAKPKQLSELNTAFKTYCTAAGNPGRALTQRTFKQGLTGVFDYNHFTRTNATYYCGYDLAAALNVNTCPYCNRNYTVTVDQPGRTTRPDFDHFFPKNAYPLLALSFYNLIPSCLICNRSVKNQKTIVYGKYLHPYEEGFEQAAKINYLPEDTDSAQGQAPNFRISLSTDPIQAAKAARCQNSFELFRLKTIYEKSHGGEIADIIRKHYVSSGKYLETLHDAFPALGTIEELYRLAFGGHFRETEFINRPLSKLTKDVVEQLVFWDPVNKKKIER